MSKGARREVWSEVEIRIGVDGYRIHKKETHAGKHYVGNQQHTHHLTLSPTHRRRRRRSHRLTRARPPIHRSHRSRPITPTRRLPHKRRHRTNSMVPRQILDEPAHRLIAQRLLRRAYLLGIHDVRGFEDITIAHIPIHRVCALCNRFRQNLRVPAVHEIAVEAEPGGVALAENVFAAGGMDLRDAVQDLVEEMHKRHRVAARALAVVDTAQIRDVRLIGLVQVDAIPARLEMDLRSEPVLAARLRQVRCLLLRRLI